MTKSNIEIWKLKHIFKSSGYIRDACWDEVLRCIFRSGVGICMQRCTFNHVLRSACWDMRCVLTWVRRVRCWSTCPSLSGLRTLPSPPPASSRGLTAWKSVTNHPTQHSNKLSRDHAGLGAMWLKEVFDFHDFFKRNKKLKNETKTKIIISLKQDILTAFISYPSISLASLNDWLQVTNFLKINKVICFGFIKVWLWNIHLSFSQLILRQYKLLLHSKRDLKFLSFHQDLLRIFIARVKILIAELIIIHVS